MTGEDPPNECMKASKDSLVHRTKQRLLTAGASFLTRRPFFSTVRHDIGTNVVRPFSLRRACTLSSREYVARKANHSVLSIMSDWDRQGDGTPEVMLFGHPEVIFIVSPIVLVLSSNKVFGVK